MAFPTNLVPAFITQAKPADRNAYLLYQVEAK